jgi:hypothetical protein
MPQATATSSTPSFDTLLSAATIQHTHLHSIESHIRSSETSHDSVFHHTISFVYRSTVLL